MWRIKQRIGISLVLLLLISIRLIPFNLLHYHNNRFANFEALGAIIGLQSTEETINIESNSCSFHQFLSLINHSFVFDAEYARSGPVGPDLEASSISELKIEFLFFEILNKGSPQLV